ncbi:MAG TPA: site-2 protease family protein [bacterium]|nr:site-2 protease family protein [bacterium]
MDSYSLLPVWIIHFLISGSLHELGHAWTARRLGDNTAELQGRITLNPAAHVDPMGLIVLVVTSLMGFGFGWMKPVPVSPWNLANPRRDLMLISAAGPMTNILQAVFWAAIFGVLASNPATVALAGRLEPFFQVAIFLNVILAAFNLLPVPPLDGFSVAHGLLPAIPAARFYNFMRTYGPLIFIAILVVPQVRALTLYPLMGLVNGLVQLAARGFGA